MGAEASVPQPASPAPARYPCFDGLRAVAALMVIVYHSVFFATWFVTPGGSLLANLNTGVWVFFVTSGFLLYRPFAAAHLDGARHVAVGSYALRRVSRIYPAYWAVLAFFTLVVSKTTLHPGSRFLENASLTQTYVHVRNPFLLPLPPAWSLVVELSFYAFLPFYAALIAVLVRRWRALGVELAGLAVLAAIGLTAIVALAEGWYDAPWIAVLPQYLVAFALGMLLAVLSSPRWSASTTARLQRIARPAWIWWSVALAIFVAFPLVLRIKPLAPMRPGQAIGLNLGASLLGLCLVVPAALGPQEHGAIRRALRGRTLAYLGVISYGLYLWHWYLLRVVQGDWFNWPLRHGNWVVVLLVTLPVVIGAATLSWYLLERPVLRWAHFVTRRSGTRAGPPVATPAGLEG